MFSDFSHRHTPCTVDELGDLVILSRETKATSIMGKESVYNGLFAPASPVQLGSFVIAVDSFLVMTMRRTVEQDKYCSLVKTNAGIQVQRYKQTYDSKDNPVGDPTFSIIESHIKSFAQYVSAQLRQEDPGLLPTTTYLLTMQKSVDVRKPQDQSLLSPDRILLNDRPYQVDVVDDVKYPNLFHVQLSEDTR
jgi:hypothetical protein